MNDVSYIHTTGLVRHCQTIVIDVNPNCRQSSRSSIYVYIKIIADHAKAWLRLEDKA